MKPPFIMDEMERVFQVPSEGILEYQLENIAINLAREYWDDFKSRSSTSLQIASLRSMMNITSR